MYSAFGVDHGYEEVEKAFNFGGGARIAQAGRHAAQSPGMLKQLSSGVKNFFSATGARSAGAHAGPMKLQNPFGSSGGARKAVGAHQAVPGGARKAGVHAGSAQIRNPFDSDGGARKAGAHAAGRRKAF